jgi:hypothetical protein
MPAMAALTLSAWGHGPLQNRIAHVAPPPPRRTKKTQRKKTHQQRKKTKKQPKKTRCSSLLKKTQPKKTALSNRLIHRTIRTAVALLSSWKNMGESAFAPG